jgi:hypothetical protein
VPDTLPWRGPGPERPVDLGHLPLTLHGRPRKRWRYVGVFGERLMLCAGVVQIGPAGQTFWAVWDRERRSLRERTRLWRGTRFVRLPHGRVWLRDGSVEADLRIEPGVAVETASPAGDAWIWTRKQGAVRVHGRVLLAGEEVAVDALGCVDESAGYHERDTAWEWSAGAGTTADGHTIGWNLVTGIHDDPDASERTVWVDGVPAQLPPGTFSEGLDAVAFPGGERLTFAAEARRRRRDDLVVFRSDYVQPFGTFAGTLPGGLALADARGVMERHTARW